MTVAVDTNILVRFFTQDNDREFVASRDLIQKETVYVSKTVILETEWVLRRLYRFTEQQILLFFRDFLSMDNVLTETPLQLAEAIELAENGLDFADALHLASSRPASRLATFDQRFITRARRLSHAIPVFHP